MGTFDGIPEEIFNCCEPSERIRKPINKLKELQAVIEPELQKINPRIIGHVSRTKKKGTNEYYDWAWLYFNTVGKEAYRYSQLTVNISPKRLYVGVNLRTTKEYVVYRKQVEKEENYFLLEDILRTLSGREWIIPTDGDWDEEVARRYSTQELRGKLLSPELFWINACFEKKDSILRSISIADEILQIFKELYNIYAFASGNKIIPQVAPKYGVFEPETIAETADSPMESDESDALKVKQFISSLKEAEKVGNYHLPGRKDQYLVKRTALEYDLRPYTLDIKGEQAIIYSDKDIEPHASQIIGDYPAFVVQLHKIRELFPLPENFLKVMFVNSQTDARYYKTKEPDSLFVNLATFRTRKNLFFWLFTISRELAYINTPRIGYPFFKDMRRIMVSALNNLFTSKK